MNKKTSIDALRDQIDALDSQLLERVNQRIDLAKEIGALKQAQSQEEASAVVIYRPEREAQVIRRLTEENKGEIAPAQINILFREIMSICRGAEAPMCIAILGPEGTFSEAAALQQFGSSIDLCYQSQIEHVFKAVEKGEANYGVVPVENSSEGVVSITADLLGATSLSIVGEIPLRIHQSLLSHETVLDQIKTVYSHAQSLSQCRGWLAEHLPHAALESVSSNAQAARMVRDSQGQEQAQGLAAIAGKSAANKYGLNILAKHIEDSSENTTRFLVLSPQEVPPSGRDKTSLLMGCKNEPGSLFSLLQPFHDHGISMLKIESRPSKQKRWEYLFFVDIEGHRLDENVAEVLQKVENAAEYFRVLGAYPRAD